MSIQWKIYYGDDSTYNSEDSSAYNVPPHNAQAIVTNGAIQSGKTAYYWSPDNGWNGCDEAGLWDHLLMFKGPKAIVFGRTIRDD